MLGFVRALKAGIVIALMSALDVPPLFAVIVVLGWWGLSEVEGHYSMKRRIQAIDGAFIDEQDWTQDPNDSMHETRGNLARVRLTDNDQVVVTRVGELVRRMAIASLQKGRNPLI